MVLASCFEQGSTPCCLFFNAFLALRHFELQCNYANVCGLFFIFAPLLRLDKTGSLVLNLRERRNVVLFATHEFGFNLREEALDLVLFSLFAIFPNFLIFYRSLFRSLMIKEFYI